MASEEAQALEMLKRINLNLRKAVLANFPCAYEQYVCLSLPGTVIDTREGATFLPATTGITADQRNAINVNEAILVDSMLPLDKVMLGPTGKSVTRSYMSSLDMLVPRKTDIGTFDLSGAANKDPNSPEHKYTLAMEYLRGSAPGISNTANDVAGAKDRLVKQGIPASTVSVYVAKQLKWSEARAKWDSARNEAIEARESHPELQNAKAFSARQKKLKSAQNELHARWMDWVVNGDKLKVDYCFAVVDRDSIMARIERAKEATRDAMLSSIDGTEWAQVHLEPPNWAHLSRSKAMAWATRHPSNPAHTQLQLESLRNMKESYQAYEAQLDQQAKKDGLVTPVIFNSMSESLTFPGEGLIEPTSNEDKAKEAAENAPADKKTVTADTYQAYKNLTAAKTDEEKVKAKWRIAMFENPTVMDAVKNLNTKSDSIDTGALARAETALRAAYQEMYRCEKLHAKDASQTNKDLLKTAKNDWIAKRTAVEEARASKAGDELSAGGLRNLKTSINSRLLGLDSEIQRLEERLGRNASLQDMIVGVKKGKTDEENTTEKQKPEVSDASGDTGTADVWTNVAFTVNIQNDEHKQEEHSTSGSFHVEAQRWFTSVKAESSFSKNNQTVSNYMAKCNVSGSFSAMVVNIKRPWLHAELFQDFDMDIPKGSFLSPGAKTIKKFVETGEDMFDGYSRNNYGKFPAYPTAFIVAADTHLSFKSGETNGQEVLNVLQTDSSVQASFGCWGIGVSAGANLKTSDKSSSQHMAVKDGNLEISFQAPQIIGWISEVLPELPRGDNPKIGGLNGEPMMGFRSNL